MSYNFDFGLLAAGFYIGVIAIMALVSAGIFGAVYLLGSLFIPASAVLAASVVSGLIFVVCAGLFTLKFFKAI